MNVEETIQFIIKQQAQNRADIRSFQEAWRKRSANIDKVSAKVDKLHETAMKREPNHALLAKLRARRRNNWM